MSAAFNSFFGWPDGGIWSNLLASVIVGVALYFWKVRGWIKKIELHHQKIHEIHRLLTNDPDDRLLEE